ncbi:hypothetical protein HJC23_001120 [Cyclotella cryptica]|uniref:Uncharacterized protein n=1 Tax=Cyclotella cryptica TaxID=29204 RepID=A0ABD3QII9_9STRA|eukprot:CCRYP_005079-RA/>CCRYP_005079-RA protein AED:0.10 eAED:0.10 QI:0/-1/0/1/-1/1/1/0/725
MNKTRTKRSDIYGHGSEDEESIGIEVPLQSRPVPPFQLRMSVNNDPPEAASRAPSAMNVRGRGVMGETNALPTPNVNLKAKVPGMFPRTRPAEQQQEEQPSIQDNQRYTYTGPVDVDAQTNVFFRSRMNGAVPAQRSSLSVTDVNLRGVAYRDAAQKHQFQEHGHRPGPATFFRRIESNGSNSNRVTFHANANSNSAIPNNAHFPTQLNPISRSSSYERNDTPPKQSSSRLRSILMKKRTEKDETATNVSRGTSTASFFGAARSKLKGYLSTYTKHPSHEGGNQYQRDSQSIPAMHNERGSVISGTKVPKYRSNLRQSNSYDNERTNGATSRPLMRTPSPASTDFARNWHNHSHPVEFSRSQSCASGMDDEAVSSYSVRTKYYDGDSSPSKKSLANKSNSKNDRIGSAKSCDVQVFDLPWVDNRPDSNLQGRYSGPVDESLLPHGRGTVVLEGNESLQFFGLFEHGTLASTLICGGERKTPATASAVEKRNSFSSANAKSVGRVPQEPSGVIIDDVPFVPNNVQPKKVDPPKLKTKTSVVDRRPSSESFSPASIQITSILRDRPSSRTSNGPMTDPQSTSSRQKYALGDVARTPRDMIIHKSNNDAIHSASLLKKYEQAFLKRSNGLWTAAVLADRSLQPTNISGARGDSSHWFAEWEIDPETMELEDSMLFVINGDGATKIVQRRHWGRFVRRMNIHDREEAIEEDGDAKSSAAGTDLGTSNES